MEKKKEKRKKIKHDEEGLKVMVSDIVSDDSIQYKGTCIVISQYA